MFVRVENTMDRSMTFRGYRNESLACRFTHSEGPLDLSKVQLTVDGEPWPLLSVERPEPDVWQVKARLRGLAAGTHALRLRTSNSEFSEPFEITSTAEVDLCEPQCQCLRSEQGGGVLRNEENRICFGGAGFACAEGTVVRGGVDSAQRTRSKARGHRADPADSARRMSRCGAGIEWAYELRPPLELSVPDWRTTFGSTLLAHAQDRNRGRRQSCT